MAANEKTFGGAISEARKAKGCALKDLAARVLREDEEAISPQYLNDIEHDRRSPSSDRTVQQFADALGIDRDWLYYLAGRFPEDVLRGSAAILTGRLFDDRGGRWFDSTGWGSIWWNKTSGKWALTGGGGSRTSAPHLMAREGRSSGRRR